MRCYHLQNMYLAGTQAGIQTAHTQHELAIKYIEQSSDNYYARHSYLDWAKNHKTIILLNGGMQSSLIEFKTLLESPDNCYPWAFFHESEEALAGALTNVGIVLPFFIYGFKDYVVGFLRSESQSGLGEYAPPPVARFNHVIIEDDHGEAYYANIYMTRCKDGFLNLHIYKEGAETAHRSHRYTTFDIELIKIIASARLM